MYADADALMNAGKFSDAAAKFEMLDREHPYSPEARRSIVMAAYAYYRAGKGATVGLAAGVREGWKSGFRIDGRPAGLDGLRQ